MWSSLENASIFYCYCCAREFLVKNMTRKIKTLKFQLKIIFSHSAWSWPVANLSRPSVCYSSSTRSQSWSIFNHHHQTLVCDYGFPISLHAGAIRSPMITTRITMFCFGKSVQVDIVLAWPEHFPTTERKKIDIEREDRQALPQYC